MRPHRIDTAHHHSHKIHANSWCTMPAKHWHLTTCDLFERLRPQEIRSVERQSQYKTFARKSPIYLPADAASSVFVLAAGRAKICHLTQEGKQSILAFIEPGEMFGELSIVDDGPRDEYAEAIEKSTVLQIPGDVIRHLIEHHPEVSLGVTRLIGFRRRRVERRLKNLLFLSNRQRLTHLLIELAGQYGKHTPAGIELTIKLSHQDLANVIGSTRETVTVELGAMQNEGLLTTGRRKITIVSAEKLAASINTELPESPTLPGSPPGPRRSIRG